MGNAADDRLTERTNPALAQELEFPRYLMMLGGKGNFLPLADARREYDRHWDDGIQLGGYILQRDMSVRRLTETDKLEFVKDSVHNES